MFIVFEEHVLSSEGDGRHFLAIHDNIQGTRVDCYLQRPLAYASEMILNLPAYP